MPQPKKYASTTERTRAFRARQKGELPAKENAPTLPPVTPQTPQEPVLPPHVADWSIETLSAENQCAR